MTDWQPTITAIERRDETKDHPSGHKLLAWFGFAAGPLRVTGCAFVKTSRNGFSVWMPNIPNQDSRRAIHVIDHSFRMKLTTAVREAYIAIGGTEAAWTPHSND